MPPVISVVGKSDSGKTTFIGKLISEIKKRGYKVAVIKHSSRGFDLDKPGKDSFLHRKAGADPILIASSDKMGMVRSIKNWDIDDLALYCKDSDIVITEGFKRGNKPKIEVFRAEKHKEPVCINDESLFAFVSDSDFEIEVPMFKTDDIKQVADLIETLFLEGDRDNG